MVKSSIRIVMTLLLIILLGGCVSFPSETSTPSFNPAVAETPAKSLMPTAAATPQHSIVPESTLPTEAIISTDDEGAEQREAFKQMRTEYGEWIYYADWQQMDYAQDDYECPIRRMKKDGSGDMELGITGFMFTIVDKYIYVYENLTFGDFGHWDTVRMDLDGGNQNVLPYGSMSITVYNNRIYFVSWNENALYAADSACEQVQKYELNLPDLQTIKDKLKNIDPVYMPRIYDVDDNWIYFHYSLVDTDSTPFYEGDYRISLDGTVIEKMGAGNFNEELISVYNE